MKVKTPSLIRFLLPGLVWEVKTEKKELFLTFDDGPHPEITPKVLDILDKYKAKATFFCVGENVSKHPQTYAEILKRGHKTANHTYNHLKGWITKNEEYYQNIQKCAAKVDSKLFRPPYGKIGLTQISAIKKDFSIVMWSVLPRDFDRKVNPEECLRNAVSNSKEGSIIVFHDSLKSAENMLFALPKFLDHFSKQGFTFPVLTSNKLI
jgi:peptidoglycan-N-acetylglucosamine deacetylase